MSEDVTKKRGRGDGEQQSFSLVTIEGEPGSRKQLKLAGECYSGVRDTGLRRVAVALCFFFVTGAATLLEASEASPESKRAMFVALVKELECEAFTVEHLLSEGKLWAAVHAAAERANMTITLGAFFDYCKRETHPPHCCCS
jgi:hypothetical protein